MKAITLTMLFVLLATPAMAAVVVPDTLTPPRETRPALDPTQAVVVARGHGWTLWRTQDMLGDRSRADRRSMRTRFFRQRAGDAEAELAHESFDQRVPQANAILADGTAVLNDYQTLFLIGPDGEERKWPVRLPGHDRGSVRAIDAIDEGVFLQSMRVQNNRRESPIFFVPFRDGLPDLDESVEITKGAGVQIRSRRPMVRYGPEVAWFDEKGLHIFDVHTREVRDVAFGGKGERYDEVRAFDGRFVVLRRIAVDTQTGKQVGKFNEIYPAALEDGVLYEYTAERANNKSSMTLNLKARDLTQNTNHQHKLRSFPTYNLYANYNSRRPASTHTIKMTAVPTKAGLHVFDGKAWITVPYLQRDASGKLSDKPGK